MPDPQSWISVNVVDSSDGDMITLNDKLPAQTADRARSATISRTDR